jgi:hypothetical protein
MATVTPTFSNDVGAADRSTVLVTWALTTANADGSPLEYTEFADKTWTAFGTWGGATLTLQGSNDGTNWFSLTNAAGGTAATFTADGGKAVIETPRYVRPNLTTVGVGATVSVVLCARRHTPVRT